MSEIEFYRRLRADAAKDLARVQVMVRILTSNYQEWLGERAAALGNTIRQFDEFLARPQPPRT